MEIPRRNYVACLTALLVGSSGTAAPLKTVLHGEWQIHWGAADAAAHNTRTGIDWLIFPKPDAPCASCEMLSVVGPLVSFRNSTTATYNLDTGEPAALTDYFGADDVLAGLLTDKRVAHAVQREHHDIPTSLDDLFARATQGGLPLSDAVLRNFAFHHVEGNRVAVRTLTGDAQALTLMLPIPAPLRSALQQAAHDKTLMADLSHR